MKEPTVVIGDEDGGNTEEMAISAAPREILAAIAGGYVPGDGEVGSLAPGFTEQYAQRLLDGR